MLSEILLDNSANAKHRIDSCKVLNDFASNGPGNPAPASDRFIIQINMGADTLTFNKSIKPDVDDTDPNDMPHLVAIAAKKPTENGGGEPV